MILAAQQGDSEAFSQLYERHAPAIFRFVYAHLDNRYDAEDLTNEVFLRVWRFLPDYRDSGAPFPAYLFRIARNLLIDTYRKNRPEMQSTEAIDDQILWDGKPEPEDDLERQLQHQEIRESLNKLRDDYRTVLLLRFLSDLSPEETAEVMGRTSGAVRVLQHRALVALRKVLVPRGQNDRAR